MFGGKTENIHIHIHIQIHISFFIQGLKLFSGPIFEAINPDGGLMANNGYLLINNILNLIGYYGCSMIIDKPKIGRVKVQAFFFTVVSIVFLMMSVLFTSLSSTGLIALFYLSGILGQFVNVTTYVMAGTFRIYESVMEGISLFSLSLVTLSPFLIFIVLHFCSAISRNIPR